MKTRPPHRTRGKSPRLKEAAHRYGIEVRPSAKLDVNELCVTYDLKREDFVRLSGFSARAIAMWTAGAAPAAVARKTLVELSRLLAGFGRVMKSGAVGAWLRAPNPAFDGSTPLQVIERGEVDRLWRMIHYLESGQPG